MRIVRLGAALSALLIVVLGSAQPALAAPGDTWDLATEPARWLLEGPLPVQPGGFVEHQIVVVNNGRAEVDGVRVHVRLEAPVLAKFATGCRVLNGGVDAICDMPGPLGPTSDISDMAIAFRVPVTSIGPATQNVSVSVISLAEWRDDPLRDPDGDDLKPKVAVPHTTLRDADLSDNVYRSSFTIGSDRTDIAITAGEVTGGVGTVVEVPVTLTNHGPAPVHAYQVTFTAPSGAVMTRLFTDQVQCIAKDVPELVKNNLTKGECRVRKGLVAAGETYTFKLPFKILQPGGKPGTIEVQSQGVVTWSPVLADGLGSQVVADWKPKDNVTELRIRRVDPDGPALPITGNRAGPLFLGGLLVLLVGAALVTAARTRLRRKI